MNQVYCSRVCKQSQNNLRSSLVRKAANGEDFKIKKAIRILLDLFKPDNEVKSIIHQLDLISRAFPFDLPTNKIKDDRYDGIMSSIGSFCFYQKGGVFYFLQNLIIMAHFQFNHLSENAFNTVVPKANKVASNKLFNKLLVVGGIALVLWLVFKVNESDADKIYENKKS